MMKRLSLPLLSSVLLIAGCSEADSGNAAALNEAAPNAAMNAAAPDEGAAEDVVIERNDDVLEYKYSWPAAAAAIVPLDTWLRDQAEKQHKGAYQPAEDYKAEAAKNGFPFNAYAYQQNWQAVADTPAALVLLGEGYEYTGGAHGMPFYVSLIWDREAQKRIATTDILDKARLAEAARESFCEKLDAQRAEKRGGPIEKSPPSTISEFNSCVNMAEHEIVPVSTGGKALDAFRVIIGPYAAGPYAEGTYEIELPVDEKLMAAVKPDYRGWFAPVGAP